MDQLFLLGTGFQDASRQPTTRMYFCPHCAVIEGFLGYYPALREKLQITYVDFLRPRPQIIILLGEENQSCPVLVLGEGDVPREIASVKIFGKHRFINDADEITAYLAATWGVAFPH